MLSFLWGRNSFDYWLHTYNCHVYFAYTAVNHPQLCTVSRLVVYFGMTCDTLCIRCNRVPSSILSTFLCICIGCPGQCNNVPVTQGCGMPLSEGSLWEMSNEGHIFQGNFTSYFLFSEIIDLIFRCTFFPSNCCIIIND